jgi:hypothetical protein
MIENYEASPWPWVFWKNYSTEGIIEGAQRRRMSGLSIGSPISVQLYYIEIIVNFRVINYYRPESVRKETFPFLLHIRSFLLNP